MLLNNVSCLQYVITVMILSFPTDNSDNSVCIFWTHYSMIKPPFSNFRVITANFWGVRIFRIFTVTQNPRQLFFCNCKLDLSSVWFTFIPSLFFYGKKVYPDQTPPHSVAPDLSLHSLPRCLLWNSRHNKSCCRTA